MVRLHARIDMALHHARNRAVQRLQLVDILGKAQDRRREPARLLAAGLRRLIEHVLDRRILEQPCIHAGGDLDAMAAQRRAGRLHDGDGFGGQIFAHDRLLIGDSIRFI